MPGRHILIIDDDPDFIKSTKVVLEAGGYTVSSAANKEEAFKQIERVSPDLIILDVMMEKMSDGFDLSRRLKSEKKYRDIPIFMVTSVGEKTGFRFSGDTVDRAWLSVDDYAEKPLPPEELIFRIGKLLSKDKNK